MLKSTIFLTILATLVLQALSVYEIPFRKQLIKLVNVPHRSELDVQVHDYQNIQYTTTINIGTPGQQFDVTIDTGSSIFWLMAPECCGKFACQDEACEQRKFHSDESSTFDNSTSDQTFGIQYGKGECSGYSGVDTFRFGPLNDVNALTIPETHFALVDKLTPNFYTNERSSGIIGLGFPQRSSGFLPPLFQAKKLGLLEENLFTVYLRSENEDEEVMAGGKITLGSIDTENCGQILGWVNLTKCAAKGACWNFGVETVTQGDIVIASSIIATSDTGCSLMYVPEASFKKIAKEIDPDNLGENYSGIYYIPCDLEYEPLVFKMANKEYSLTKDILTLSSDDGGKTCMFGIANSRNSLLGEMWLLGDPFIRQFCHIYDFGNKRIGFAQIKETEN